MCSICHCRRSTAATASLGFSAEAKWHWTCSGDLIHNGRLIDKGEFDARFGELPPLPVKNR